MKDLSKEIWAYSLRNAIEYDKADVSKVLPKLFNHGLEKGEIKEVMPLIKEIVKEVNSMNSKEREKMFSDMKGLVKEKEQREGLKELPGIKKGKKLVFRMAPFPSGALHMGNMKTFMLNVLYAEKYGGEVILVMDDTIGSAEKPIVKEAYDLIIDACDWLNIDYGGKKNIFYKSDRVPIYYEYAENLIDKDKAYVCHCSQTLFKKLKDEGKDCGCRRLPKKIQKLRWKEMFKAKEGHSVLRIKTSMRDKNPAFRDRVLFKVSDRKHARVGNKYRVWPTLEMSWAIDDHLLGVTHIIRGNDLLLETEMERYIWKIFGWEDREIIHTGLVNLTGMKISKSKSQKDVKSGKFIGWEDPRTGSIQSLEKRGIRPEAFRKFVEEIGLNKQDTTAPIENLFAINRKLIDPEVERYSFIENPQELKIKGRPEMKKVNVRVHPDKEDVRELFLGNIFVSKEDFEKAKGKEIRLLHLFDVKLNGKGEAKYVESKKMPSLRINWVSNSVNARVLMPNGEYLEGVAEESIKKLKKGTLIQFERFGFVRFDGYKTINNKKVYGFWFTHK